MHSLIRKPNPKKINKALKTRFYKLQTSSGQITMKLIDKTNQKSIS